MSDRPIGRLANPVKVYVEVTDTISIPYTTGIQRVVREILTRLDSDDYPDLDVIPIFRPAPQVDYRRLTDAEAQALRVHPAGGAASRRADRFGVLSPLVRLAGDTKVVYQTRIHYRHLKARIRERQASREDLAIGRMEQGSVFFDTEGSWFDPEPRSTLLPRVLGDGLIPVVFVHDVMPTLYPQWFDKRQVTVFNDWLSAHIHHSDVFLTNSRCTSKDLLSIAGAQGVDLNGRMRQIPLGADFMTGESKRVPIPSAIGRYLLVVGTIEPRKNHRNVLDAWNRLRNDHPDLGLIFVGKEGWMVTDLAAEIRAHEDFSERFLWLGGLEDSELLWLYQNAFITLAMSQYEGLGVPVIEALKNGCPAIVSTGGALPEAGEGHTELVDPGSLDALVETIRRHLTDPDHHRAQVELAESFESIGWEQTTEAVAEAIRFAATRREPSK